MTLAGQPYLSMLPIQLYKAHAGLSKVLHTPRYLIHTAMYYLCSCQRGKPPSASVWKVLGMPKIERLSDQAGLLPRIFAVITATIESLQHLPVTVILILGNDHPTSQKCFCNAQCLACTAPTLIPRNRASTHILAGCITRPISYTAHLLQHDGFLLGSVPHTCQELLAYTALSEVIHSNSTHDGQ